MHCIKLFIVVNPVKNVILNSLNNTLKSLSIKVFVREKNPQQKKERAAETFFNKIKHQTS